MGFKGFLLRQAGKRYKNMEWLKRNKALVGFIFAALGLYVWNFGCPGLESYCEKLGPVLTNIGAFLAGAGVLPSDFREKVVQGKVDILALKAQEMEKKNGNSGI